MSPHPTFTRIPLQAGGELRIRNNGELSVSNPNLDGPLSLDAADAVLAYRFDPHTGEHVVRLMEATPRRRRAK